MLLRVPSPYLCDNIKKLCTSGNKGLLAKKEVHVSRMYYMGIDLHKKYFVSTIMDKEGKVLKKEVEFPLIENLLSIILVF